MSELPEDDPLEDRLCLMLYRSSHAMTAAYRTVLEPLGLTYPQYTVLSALWRSSPLRMAILVELLGSDYGTMSPLIKRLEGKALVQRARDGSDEREVQVHLTAGGRDLRGQAADVQRVIREASGLSESRVNRLVGDLEHLTAQLRRFNG